MAYQVTEEIMVENARSPDAIEGMKAFLERRTPQWQARVEASG
jgi:enoyl-CoA hydratase/carnithine racemase